MEVKGSELLESMQSDDGLMPTILLVVMTSMLVLCYMLRTKAKKYPPGPLAFPIVGNLPQLALCGSVTNFANHYRKRYGDVFSFVIGKRTMVIISGYDTMHELCVTNGEFTSTRNPETASKNAQESMRNSPGVIYAPFPHWKTLRTLAICTLREEGMGKAAFEPKVQEEIELYISSFLEPKLGKPMQMKPGLMLATCNIISQMLFNKRSDYKDGKFQKLVKAIDVVVSVGVKLSFLASLPDVFSRWFTDSLIKQEKECINDVVNPAVQRYIDEHKADLDEEHPRDVTDRFLIQAARKGNQSNFSDANCLMFAIQIYAAGTDSTAAALSWALLYMCLHPEKQRRVQQEIDEILGRDKPASCKDRVNMPYTDAVLLESLRKGNVAPIGLPHSVEKDLLVGNTLIPDGSELIFNMSSALNDETVFEEPYKFKPERYLTGDIALKKRRTIAFGLGRRACLGESLAKTEFFLFFTTFLQRYKVRLPEGSTASDEPMEATVCCPKPYDIIFERR